MESDRHEIGLQWRGRIESYDPLTPENDKCDSLLINVDWWKILHRVLLRFLIWLFTRKLLSTCFQVVLIRDYLILHLLCCVREESEVRRWEFRRINRIRNSPHCLSVAMLLSFLCMRHTPPSKDTSSRLLPTLRLAFVFSLDNSGIRMTRT
jgi:hypothetical protein